MCCYDCILPIFYLRFHCGSSQFLFFLLSLLFFFKSFTPSKRSLWISYKLLLFICCFGCWKMSSFRVILLSSENMFSSNALHYVFLSLNTNTIRFDTKDFRRIRTGNEFFPGIFVCGPRWLNNKTYVQK